MTTSQSTAAPTRKGALATLVVLAACGQAADMGAQGEDGPGAEVSPQPGDTASAPPRADGDDPGAPPGTTDSDAPPGAADPDQAGNAVSADEPAGDTTANDTLPELVPQLRIPGGTEVSVTTDYNISTDVHAAGDPVVATVIEDVFAADGTLLIPRGVVLLGRVEAAAGSGGVGELPILEVSFETLSAWSYERPIETLVTQAPVTIDPEADRARRRASGRDAMTLLPGRIMAGSIIVVQLREAVFVPGDATMWLPGDSLAPRDRPDSGGSVRGIP